MVLENYKDAISLIGANIEAYGHFAVYSIPYENSKGIVTEKDVTKEEFLKLVDDYYNSSRLNLDYGDDVKESNSNKRFIKKRVRESSYQVGLEWLEEAKFKDSDEENS